MLAARLRARVPSARAIGTAPLLGYALRWHKVSVDGSGKCDVETDATPSACVWGVVYEIDRSEKLMLDRAEGLGKGYAERMIQVQAAAGPIDVHLYYATQTRIDRALMPYDWYKRFVVEGAKENA